ncbi:MAG: ATP-binding protein [Planctomycetota bacterium]
MSIRTKLALTFFVAAALFLALDHALRRASFVASFEILEEARAQAEVGRARAAFEHLTDDLAFRARNLARSDSFLDPESAPPDVELIVVVDESGRVHRRDVIAPACQPDLEIREFPGERLSPGHPVAVAWRSQGPPAGIFRSRAGSLLLASAEIEVDGVSRLLVLGELVDAKLLAQMRQLADSDFEFVTVDSPRTDERTRAAFDDERALNDVLLQPTAGGAVMGYAALRDIRGLPIALIHTPAGGERSNLWSRLERYQYLSALAVLLVFPLILLVLSQAVVTGPLSRLTNYAAQIGHSDDASKRLALSRKDEIGRLAQEFDAMLEKLERSRVEQQRTARFAGRSEVAIGVMHNVGNLANSVGVSAALARDRFSGIDLTDLRAVHDELVANRKDLDRFVQEDERGQHVFAFLSAIIERMESEITRAREDVDSVVEDVRGITELVQALEDSKRTETVVERVDVAKEIEGALRLAVSSTGVEVEIVQDVANVPRVLVDRQRLLETLVAVLSNALESMEGTPQEERFLVVCVDQPDDARVRIAVRDFGNGIERDDLRRIFAPGVSTKTYGSGFGLHLASLAIAELGGTLEAASDGRGRGATFTIELPVVGVNAETGERDAA